MSDVINPVQIRTAVTGKRILGRYGTRFGICCRSPLVKSHAVRIYHKSFSEQAVLADAAQGDRRRKSFRIAEQISSIAAYWFSVFLFVSNTNKILQKYPKRKFG